MFLKLTLLVSEDQYDLNTEGDTVLVAIDAISRIDIEEGGATRIVVSAGAPIFVDESLGEIETALLRHDLLIRP